MTAPKYSYLISSQAIGGYHFRDAVLARSDGQICILPDVPHTMTPPEARALGEALIQAADWADAQGEA